MKSQYFLVIIFLFLLFIGCDKSKNNATPKLYQQKLVGTWTGSGTTTYGNNNWNATFVIEKDGRYSGHINFVNAGSITAVLDNGNDDLDNSEKKIIMQSIDAFDKANGKINFVHSNGSLMTYSIDDLTFSNNYKQIDFTAKDYRIIYSLTKD